MPDTRPTFYGSFRESNAVALEILEPPLAAGVPIELDIYDGANPATMLATLEAARSKRWNPQLSDVGAGSAVLNRHDPKATPAIIRRGNLAKVKIGGKYRGAWWLEDIDRTLVARGEKGAEDIKIAGRGEIAYLERGTMWTESYVGDDPIDGRWDLGEAGTGNALGDMLRRVLEELQARPDGSPVPHLSIGWPYGSDSQGAAWDDTADLEPEVGANTLGVWQQLTALGLESEMTHELEMRTYRELGRHFEQPPTGNGSVTFLQGKHILGDWHERDRGGARKTRVIVKGADNVTLTVADLAAEADPYLGRRETSISVGSSSDPTTLQRAGEMTLAALRAEGEQLELPVAHGSGPGEYEPFVHYRNGDFVAVERSDGTYETHRIVGMIFEEIPGDYALTLQLNSIRVEALIRLKRMIDALGGGSTTAGTSGGSAISGGGSGGSGGGGSTGDGKVSSGPGDTPGYLYDQLAAGNGIAKALTGGGAAQDVELRLDLPGAIEDDVPAWDDTAGLWVPRARGAGGGAGEALAVGDYTEANAQISASTTQDILTRTLDLPAGRYLLLGKAWVWSVGVGNLNLTASAGTLSTGTTDPRTNTGERFLFGYHDHPGGPVTYAIRHTQESGTTQYGSGGDPRFGRELLVVPLAATSAAAAAGGSFLGSAKLAADTPDDEFNAAALAAKWTVASGAASAANLLESGTAIARYDLTTRPGWLLTQVGGTTSGTRAVKLRQAFTLPDGASIVAAVATPTPTADDVPGFAQNERQVGIALTLANTAEDASPGLRLFASEVDVDTLQIQSLGVGHTAGDANGDAYHVGWGRMIYLRIARSGLWYYTFYSQDGTTWVPFGAAQWAAAHAYLWLFDNVIAAASGTPIPITAWAWIRQGGNGIDPWPWL
jgi:hypothetical protein